MSGSPDPLPSPWPDRERADLVDVRLIRHGETQTYTADRGLTDRGREQALAKGSELARRLAPGDVVRLPHAPTNRAAETAAGVREGLLSQDGTERVDVEKPVEDDRFHNFRLWCGDEALDPTQAFATYRAALDAGTRTDWFDEMHQFSCILAAGGDPIGFWLTQPVQHFEPAAAAVRRFWHGITDHARHAELGLHVFVSTHSGCIRALAAAAVGHDPGEPENTEDVRIRISPQAHRAVLAYRGHGVELAVPTGTAPPWRPLSDARQHEGDSRRAQR